MQSDIMASTFDTLLMIGLDRFTHDFKQRKASNLLHFTSKKKLLNGLIILRCLFTFIHTSILPTGLEFKYTGKDLPVSLVSRGLQCFSKICCHLAISNIVYL